MYELLGRVRPEALKDWSPMQWICNILNFTPKNPFPIIVQAQEMTVRYPALVWRAFTILILTFLICFLC